MLDSESTQRDLLALDEIREQNRLAAVSQYLSAPTSEIIANAERLLWVLENLGPVPAPEALPLLSDVIDQCDEMPLRLALHSRAVVHWYQGETRLAEADWRRALEASRIVKDRTWIRAHNNLALCMSARGGYFEALVLFGAATRLAAAAGKTASLAFAHSRRGQMLALLGDQERATEAFARADEVWREIREPKDREFLASALWAAKARQSWVQRDWQGVLRAQEQRLEELASLPPAHDPTLANAHTLRLRALFELEPEKGAKWLSELARLPERYQITALWESQWRREVAALEFRTARAEGAPSVTLEALGEVWLHCLEASSHGSELVDEAVRIAQFFREAQLDELARRAFDLAATETLKRLVEAHAATRNLPELADATPEDWQVLREHRERLVADQTELLETVARFWKPGHPAFELVVVDELIRLCAWCQRVRMRDSSWIPVAGFLPADSVGKVSHAICEECRKEFFDIS